jgi:Tfp pilus assembly protein PilO
MKQENKQLYSIILAGIIVVAAILVYFEFIVPAYTNLEAVKGQEESEATLYANETQIVNQGKALLATYQSEASSSQSVTMALPVGQDVSGALAQIYGIATNANLTIQNIGVSVQAVVAPPAQDDTTDGTIANAAAQGSVIKPTGTVSFQVSGFGSYESFKSFLQGLETNIRIFNVTAVSLQPSVVVATKTQAANTDMFNYTITVVTYYQAP